MAPTTQMARMARIAALALLATLVFGACATTAIWIAIRPARAQPAPAREALRLGPLTLVEPGHGRRAGARLWIRDGVLAGAADAPVDEPPGAFAGHYVLPGLTDMHVHMPMTGLPDDAAHSLFLLLAHGVTQARILGGTSPEETATLRNAIAGGTLAGPRLFSCGPFLDGPSPVLPGARVLRSADEARAAVDDLVARGVDCVKPYDRLDRETALAVRDAAKRHGIPVVGHTPQALTLAETHWDDVQHLRGVHPAFEDEAMAYPHFLGAWRRMDEARTREVIDIARRHGMAFTPTLSAIQGTLSARRWNAWRTGPVMSLQAPHLRDGIWSAEVGFNPVRFMAPAEFDVVETALVRMQRTVLALHRAGIALHTGTDANAPNVVPGASLHEELALLVRAGLSPEEALALSTRDSPRFLGIARAGELRVGVPANLVVFREDPTRDVAALATLVAVVADGRLYTREELDARRAAFEARHRGLAYERIFMPMLRTGLRAVTALAREMAPARH